MTCLRYDTEPSAQIQLLGGTAFWESKIASKSFAICKHKSKVGTASKCGYKIVHKTCEKKTTNTEMKFSF